MIDLKYFVPLKIFEVIDRAGIGTAKQILLLSHWDIKKITKLTNEDIGLLKNVVSQHICPKTSLSNELLSYCNSKINSGCKEIDEILDGGFCRRTITEIYGESGSGKTQIGLQVAASNWPNCTVYICTEDLFPIKRFNEIKQGLPNFKSDLDYGSTTFVEHITESKDLLSCIRVRLPKLLLQNKFTLIVLDSVAAPFRVENTNYVERAEEMRELAMSLLRFAQDFNLAILCINQVTASFESSVDILPSLGLAWSNMVSTRLYLEKKNRSIGDKCIRQLSVVFAPNVPNSKAEFLVTSDGLQSI